ncbi:MAG TPA: hypothetical protein VMU56_08545 [Beijerinckiaceae bacterium]|nr:hypothetical protein [Beijerinckiaceae bacterium]
MTSESARATSRAESAYRIPYPNSRARAVKVIALDASSAALLDELARLSWNGARFFTAASPTPERASSKTALKTWLADLAGHVMDLVVEVAQSDFVVVVASAGEDARSVSVIAEICELHHKTLIALVVPRDGDEEALAASLRQLRPHAKMLVVTQGRDYVETMLSALRA